MPEVRSQRVQRLGKEESSHVSFACFQLKTAALTIVASTELLKSEEVEFTPWDTDVVRQASSKQEPQKEQDASAASPDGCL